MRIGDRVEKTGGDYWFEGTIIAKFTKLRTGLLRFVVEDDRGLLFIFSEKSLKLK